MSTPDRQVEPGAILSARYLLHERLGLGGMGAVYRATDLRTSGQVAIKVVHAHVAAAGDSTARLRREAQLAASLVSPRIVRVMDFAIDPATEVTYLVQEYIAGHTLADLLTSAGPLPVTEALSIVGEVARALAAAHAAGIIHRDLKPSNIMLVDGQVKVLDFGIARAIDDVRLTAPGRYLGTPLYAAPELAEGKGDRRADLYALGVILYELLTGRPPFDALTPLAVLQLHATAPAPPLPPDVPATVAAIVTRCLAKDPAARYQAAAELVAALETARGESRQSPPLFPPSTATATVVVPDAVLAGMQPATSTPPGSGRVSPLPLPVGTVTLLFTDIEGSTRLQQQLGTRYAEVQATHRGLLRQAFAAQGGVEVDTQGDAFFYVFVRATQAVAAAVAAQQALAAHVWPHEAPVRVRMGIHTGEPQRTEEGYVGLDLVRGARIMATGHGGQLLLSGPTMALVHSELPAGVQLRDLGAHRLKDLAQPERVCQLLIPGLANDFPPPRSLDSHPNNLPLPTPLIGREGVVAEVCALLRREHVRLVTLTGAGGSGKTRLGLRVAAELLPEVEHGAFVVSLAPLADPELVIPTIAHALSVRETEGRPLPEALRDYLREKHLLLVLDNFEQVLVASRAALRLTGEQEYPVPPLALPAGRARADGIDETAAIARSPAVQLFVERSRGVRPDFALTEANARVVAQICMRLDGLPLALELAAARIKHLTLPALLDRLARRLTVLTGGARDAPARQRTLRDTIAWSYDLLSPDEQRVVRRLAVFAGGCSLEAAEAVCNVPRDLDVDVLSSVASLVDKSLLTQQEGTDGEPRYVMLETIHEFARERLDAAGETAAIQGQHASFFLNLAETAEPELRGPDQGAWLALLEAEHDNLRAALAWSVTVADEDETALRLAGALLWFWEKREHLDEAHRWLEGALARATPARRTAARAKALYGAGRAARLRWGGAAARPRLEESAAISEELGDLAGVAYARDVLSHVAWYVGDRALARSLAVDVVARFRTLGDEWGLALSLETLGTVLGPVDPIAARAACEESMTLWRALRDPWGFRITADTLMWVHGGVRPDADTISQQAHRAEARALYEESLALARAEGNMSHVAGWLRRLGNLAHEEGDDERAGLLLEEALALTRRLGWRSETAVCLQMLGRVAQRHGDSRRAAACFEESLALCRALGDKWGVAALLSMLGILRYTQGDAGGAAALLREGLTLGQETGMSGSDIVAGCLEGLAAVSGGGGRPRRAARLLGAAEALRQASGEYRLAAYQSLYESGVAALRAGLGEEAFAAAWAAGAALPLEEAVAEALRVDGVAVPRRAPPEEPQPP